MELSFRPAQLVNVFRRDRVEGDLLFSFLTCTAVGLHSTLGVYIKAEIKPRDFCPYCRVQTALAASICAKA